MNHQSQFGREINCARQLGTRPIGVFRAGPMAISPAKVLRVYGYKEAGKVRRDVSQAAQKCAELAERLIDIEIHHCRLGVRRCTPLMLELMDGTRFESEIFARYTGKAREVLAFVLTTGGALDEEVKRCIDASDLVEAIFLEASGWLAIEAATRAFSVELRKTLAHENLRPSMRLGPGYIYSIDNRTTTWPLEQQRELFGVFKDHHLPVTLLESCAMQPKLSRSGLYGLLDRPSA